MDMNLTSKQTPADERISFKEVIELVLKTVHSCDFDLNSEAIWTIESILNDVLNLLIQEVQKSQTTTNDIMKSVNDAVIKIFAGDLRKYAIRLANEALSKSQTSPNCGLTFNYQIIGNYLRQKISIDDPTAAIFITATLEYLSQEILENSGNAVLSETFHQKHCITLRFIMNTIINDDELSEVLKFIAIARAKKLGIKITDENDFISVLRDLNPDANETAADDVDKTTATDKVELPRITNQENLSDLIQLQELLYSNSIDTNSLQTLLKNFQKKYSSKEIDHQLILAFSLDYTKVPILVPFLSNKFMTSNDFIHADQELLNQLIESNVIFPLMVLWEKCLEFNKLTDEDYETPYNTDGGGDPLVNCRNFGVHYLLYYHVPDLKIEENLMKQFQQIKIQEGFIEIRKKEEIEEIINNDDLEKLRLLDSKSNFNFNSHIKKENLLYLYSSIPLLSYCIEKKAIKCFKYLLINGADPLQKTHVPIVHYNAQYANCEVNEDEFDEIWDAFGFAVAIGDIQYIKILQNQVGHFTNDLVMGCCQFHKNDTLSWILNENPSIIKYGLNHAVKYENIKAINLMLENPDLEIDVNIKDRYQRTPIHYAARNKLLPIFEMFIKKGADITEDENGNTPLDDAAKSDSLEIAQILMDKKEKINSYSKPLAHAVQFNSKRVCKLLVDFAIIGCSTIRRTLPL